MTRSALQLATESYFRQSLMLREGTTGQKWGARQLLAHIGRTTTSKRLAGLTMTHGGNWHADAASILSFPKQRRVS